MPDSQTPNAEASTIDDSLPGAQVLDRVMTWLKGRQRSLLAIGVGIQIVLLLSMIGLHSLPLLVGETVLVKTAPVDPRDYFRGDYVILSYDFSRVPAEGIDGLKFENGYSALRDQIGRTVYVPLVPDSDGRHRRAGRMSIHRPDDGLFLRGRLAGWNRIEYGIEAFYLQEGEGRRYEQAIRDGSLSAEIAVTSGGQAKLRRLLISDDATATAAAVAEPGNAP